MTPFETTADQFETHRALPAGAAEAIRARLWAASGAGAGARLLEIGAGTGCVGHAFHAAGDAYVGVDVAGAMLRQFAGRGTPGAPRPCLVQADGAALPFADGGFAVVLLVQVLSGVHDWRGLLQEARRVAGPKGALALGQTVPPADGVDVQMRAHLAEILTALGREGGRPGARYGEACGWLGGRARQHQHGVACTWEQRRTPRAFLARHRGGARFARLPLLVQEEALRRLAAWATTTFGDLDAAFTERWAFELDVFMFSMRSV